MNNAPLLRVLPVGVLLARKENMTAAQSSIEALRIAARAAEEKQGTNLFAVVKDESGQAPPMDE